LIPKRYLIATLFIAAMLVLLAVVQAPRTSKEGGVVAAGAPSTLVLETFESLAEYRLLDSWAPRFEGAQDPDQSEPWPFPGGFGTPWEPASPYLGDQGLALNGPGGRSEVVLWKGLEWRHYRFDAPMVSARLDPIKGHHLLVTLRFGNSRFETRLMEVPEGRVLWVADSGPWSRFSWDGKAVLLGLKAPESGEALLLSTIPVEGGMPAASLATWNEPGLPPAPKDWPVLSEKLWDDGKDLPGARLLVPWPEGSHLWFPQRDRLWVSGGGTWSLWGLEANGWRRLDVGEGVLMAQPPLAMGCVALKEKEETPRRFRAPLDIAEWKELPVQAASWPAYDAAWFWLDAGQALTAWDQRWGKDLEHFPPERQRETLGRAYSADFRVASELRVSVRGWLPNGPEIALREAQNIAWVWIGDRVHLVRLQPTDRLRQLKAQLRLK